MNKRRSKTRDIFRLHECMRFYNRCWIRFSNKTNQLNFSMVLTFIVKKEILKFTSGNICYNAGSTLILQQVEKRYTWDIRLAPLIFSKLFEICERVFF